MEVETIQIIIPKELADRVLEHQETANDWEAVRTAIDVAGSIRDMTSRWDPKP